MANSHITEEARVPLVTSQVTLMLLSCLVTHTSITQSLHVHHFLITTQRQVSIKNSLVGGKEINSCDWRSVGGTTRVVKEINSEDSS